MTLASDRAGGHGGITLVALPSDMESDMVRQPLASCFLHAHHSEDICKAETSEPEGAPPVAPS